MSTLSGERSNESIKEAQQVLSISIVTYAADLHLLQKTIKSLSRAVKYAKRQGLLDHAVLVLVDNGPGGGLDVFLRGGLHRIWPYSLKSVRPFKNVGFGVGHNMALKEIASSSTDYHLILNPDVIMEESALSNALLYMTKHPETGCLTPYASWPDGSRQYLCKGYPSIFTLFLRGFAPKPFAAPFARRLADYELRGVTEQSDIDTIKIASGCFMLCRRRALDEIGGFSNRFFLYFEDFDLSLRLSRNWRIAYVPSVRIIHFGGRSSLKGLRSIVMFVRSAATFFNMHGWRWF
ncbi:glycosyltransferase [Dissulfurimicrobium hydrothermale]|uniref:glycosyltransferase n=1 Tax=Dissulfurimicrobium hydrothermale TaxID=1750598 RepID=UPI001EDB6771|nr:glycosyltransferase [Dissulfurimicrobium hydrothermale]UKL13923.1 glycosyltransferase [Dissulfurimicrobium hydrothermale]